MRSALNLLARMSAWRPHPPCIHQSCPALLHGVRLHSTPRRRTVPCAAVKSPDAVPRKNNLTKYKMTELREMLRIRSLSPNGKKVELVERLTAHLAELGAPQSCTNVHSIACCTASLPYLCARTQAFPTVLCCYLTCRAGVEVGPTNLPTPVSEPPLSFAAESVSGELPGVAQEPDLLAAGTQLADTQLAAAAALQGSVPGEGAGRVGAAARRGAISAPAAASRGAAEQGAARQAFTSAASLSGAEGAAMQAVAEAAAVEAFPDKGSAASAAAAVVGGPNVEMAAGVPAAFGEAASARGAAELATAAEEAANASGAAARSSSACAVSAAPAEPTRAVQGPAAAPGIGPAERLARQQGPSSQAAPDTATVAAHAAGEAAASASGAAVLDKAAVSAGARAGHTGRQAAAAAAAGTSAAERPRRLQVTWLGIPSSAPVPECRIGFLILNLHCR